MLIYKKDSNSTKWILSNPYDSDDCFEAVSTMHYSVIQILEQQMPFKFRSTCILSDNT